MVRNSWFSPFQQVGNEIRIELRVSFEESRFAGLVRRISPVNVSLLPEQRADDWPIIDRRKAEALLRSVRHGAVRR
ncbi:MAG: hypothetical protein R2848_02460 [Thermomicrobiales bacterium]